MPNPQRTTTFRNVVFDIELKITMSEKDISETIVSQKKQIITINITLKSSISFILTRLQHKVKWIVTIALCLNKEKAYLLLFLYVLSTALFLEFSVLSFSSSRQAPRLTGVH
jgi:hypothetical protein